MAGKRLKKTAKKRGRLAGTLAVLAALGILLTAGGSSGIAVGSPAEAATAEGLRLEEREETVRMEKAAPQPEEEKEASGPVPESEPVENDYFDDIVFMGDSRTEGFYLYSGMKQHGQYLYAVGATVESVFTKNAWEIQKGRKVPLLDALAELDCKKVYLMFGVNELGWTKLENFTNQYSKLIDRIREDHPEAQVVLQSILPVTAKEDAKGTYVNNARIRTYNEALQTLAAEKDCPYINVAEAVTGPDGCLPVKWTTDGVHLNVEGCRVWLHYLRTHSVS
ncbi:MAG: hypothetical protein HFF90_00615 [Oscillibacter sp.]|nr:hypothetical protein [Oscillibacter sp.]